MTIDNAILKSALERNINHAHLVEVLGEDRVNQIQSSINLHKPVQEKQRLEQLGKEIRAAYNSLPNQEPEYDVTTGEQYAL